MTSSRRPGNRITTVLLVLGAMAPACTGERDDAAQERTSDIIAGTPLAFDPNGSAFLALAQGNCSATFLSPQWLISAGHCFRENHNGFVNATPPFAWATLGTNTDSTTAINTSEVDINPNWWNPAIAPSNPLNAANFVDDRSYDVALLRLTKPFSGDAYDNGLYNWLSNGGVSVGQTLDCYGYGFTSTAGGGSGGGIGKLQTAQLPVTSTTARVPNNIGNIGYTDSADMINVGTNSAGQMLFNGDSGGTCTIDFWSPNAIAAINESVSPASAPTTGWLVDASLVVGWVDETMHGSPVSVTKASNLTKYVSTSVTTANGRTDYVVAFAPSPGRAAVGLYVNSWSEKSNAWSGWLTFNTDGLPGAALLAKDPLSVGLSAVPSGTGAHLYFAALGTDHQMYVADLISAPNAANSRTTWNTVTWTAAGTPSGLTFSTANLAVGVFEGRLDYFALGSDAKIWTRWKASGSSGAWSSTWTKIPSTLTFVSGPSVTLIGGDSYILGAAASDRSGSWHSVLPFISPTVYAPYGTWQDWFLIGGMNLLSGVTVAGGAGGVDVYAIGGDGGLWHMSLDPNWTSSPWAPLNKGTTFSQPLPWSPSASNLSPDARQVDMLTMKNGTDPVIVRYPR